MITVLVVLLTGALAVGLAFVIVRPQPGPRAALFGVVLVLLLIAGEFVAYKYVTPRVQAAISGPSLADMPLYRAIRKYEPAMYGRLDRDFKAAVKSGKRDQFMQTALTEVGQLAQRHMAAASNESVHDLMKHAIVQLRELQRKPGDACFRFLFPQVSGPADLSLLPKSMVDANAVYFEDVLVSAFEHPQPPPSASESRKTLEPILQSMAQTYGQDLQMLSNPGGSELDRRRICEISVDLYDQILHLPKEQGAGVLRFMISAV